MNIIALETSHAVASVALLTDTGIYEKKIESDLRHEETVMPAVVALLEEYGIEAENLDCVAVDVGPGSFTGIRIGICHANAMADAVSIPCIGISALQAMAFHAGADHPVAVMIDAGNRNCYAAVYSTDGALLYGPSAESTDSFKFVAKERFGIAEEDIALNLPDASAVVRLAMMMAEKNGENDLRAVPLYLRPSQAERKRNI